ncbi:flagellar biosynthesis protein FlgE [Aeromonas schubertii]|uniref:Flagellar biosynthesis protein FlgE n=2 Tax=Aeromonas schubertii TaxID=652 RepID=A0ABS7VB28_9GAMM|nr:flagellar biosynthesis protein FlgE [Aeromonas schubertii]KUE81177.1 flagellar biosynthesis protein FlgE [Aeromonas schubertii]MBZ6066563.1 flagellar biosynthesis protein FlgE [Aeromonas schubertii]MBZ6073425.1 flagellar biosynthesis protein FlgE [Aeromonas schubertii]QCG49655.1 flagellar biosynthesis protein FlgE [Aeromonas schubertii]
MRIDSAMTNGTIGFQRAEKTVADASASLASLSTPSGDKVNVPEELVNLKVGELQAGANARVIKSANEMMGTLIDIRV